MASPSLRQTLLTTAVEAIILAGGKAERLGEAAQGRPKALVRIGGRPLAAHQVSWLARAGVARVLVSCAAGQEGLFEAELAGLGPEIVTVPEREPLGRGGGIRLAASARREEGAVYAMNGDELLDADLAGLLVRHREAGVAATIVIARPRSAFGVVELGEGDLVTGFHEAGLLPHWVSCGLYVLGEEAIAELPERGDHETTTFPALAERRRLAGFRHDGVWLTVNTPKDLRAADEYVHEHPEWLDSPGGAGL